MFSRCNARRQSWTFGQIVFARRLLRTAARRKRLSSTSLEQLDETTTGHHDLSDVKSSATQAGPLTDLLAKQIALDKSLHRRVALLRTRAIKLQQEGAIATDTLIPNPGSSEKHHDLLSFLAYAQASNLKTNTTVYKGTLFEYTVADAMRKFGMTLRRVGKANDRGIDLIGDWTLPSKSVVPIFIQCKVAKALPQVIRELEGTCSNAPATWSGSSKIALLASCQRASPGTVLALQSSAIPLAFLQVTLTGVVKQFLWNPAASDRILAGLGVAKRCTPVAHGGKDVGDSIETGGEQSIVLTWEGLPWTPP